MLMTTKTPVEQTVALTRKRGKAALDFAKESIQQEKVAYKPLQEALCYFFEEFFKDVTQPGLLSLYCEAVGGDPEETTKVGAAMVLLVGAADLHDDIIDNSKTKSGRLTVFGKFGKEIAILAGDAFIVKGVFLLNEATEQFPEQKRALVLNLIKQAFLDLSSTEAEEAHCYEKTDLTGQQYLEILKKKTAVSEATARIGAILGNGTAKEIETLGKIGVAVGLLNTIRDEFIDIFEPEELKNRVAREILPLPLLFVSQDPKKKEAITQLLKEGRITKERTEKIVNIVMAAKETEALWHLMRSQIRESVEQLANLRFGTKALKLLLESTLEDLQ
jgi:geranylgeranyl pyrophosphate synthase